MNKKELYDKKIELMKEFLKNNGNIDYIKIEQEKLNEAISKKEEEQKKEKSR